MVAEGCHRSIIKGGTDIDNGFLASQFGIALPPGSADSFTRACVTGKNDSKKQHHGKQCSCYEQPLKIFFLPCVRYAQQYREQGEIEYHHFMDERSYNEQNAYKQCIFIQGRLFFKAVYAKLRYAKKQNLNKYIFSGKYMSVSYREEEYQRADENERHNKRIKDTR